jgi:small nuclear ribonucleoprotein (snRNP)-like protein
LPLSLLRAGKDNPMLVELKNGETYNGILINCDIWYPLSLACVRIALYYGFSSVPCTGPAHARWATETMRKRVPKLPKLSPQNYLC